MNFNLSQIPDRKQKPRQSGLTMVMDKGLSIEEAKGNCFLGIDAGSTTTKATLINEEGEILYSYYASNRGNPVNTAVGILKEIYK